MDQVPGDEDATAVDLTALLDVLSNIIFFLMVSFGATLVAVLPAKVPTVADEENPDSSQNLGLVSVVIKLSSDGGVDISAFSEDVDKGELHQFDKVILGDEGKIDAEALNAHLWGIKQRFESSNNLVLVPAPDVRYEMMVEVMDVARERSMERGGRQIYEQLFPAVIVRSETL